MKEIFEVSFNDFKYQILKLRQAVWEQTDYLHMKQLFTDGFYDQYDDEAFHWVIMNGNNIIASARMSKHNSISTLPDQHLLASTDNLKIDFPIASLNRLVVSKQFQGQGLSNQFDDIRVAKAIEQGCKSICVLTYGLRGNKLKSDGYQCFHTLTLSDNFQTNKINAKLTPPAFYYKSLSNRIVNKIS
jgi:predicted GNAT family N-acyltransferase